jgi:hypothetical protein
MRKRILAKDVHKKWLKDPAYREAYASLAEEFALAAAVIEARSRARHASSTFHLLSGALCYPPRSLPLSETGSVK